jgi:cytochrome b pre-mRNA-processing protein 3
MFGLFKPKKNQDAVYAAYAAIVAQARQPEFYLSLQVPDTTVSRFENIVLHIFLLLHRLKIESKQDRDFGQQVFDLFFLDMDRSLREAGVGDVSVPKRVKKMAEAFFGRIKSYDEALSGEAELSLDAAIGRYLYPEPPENKALLLHFAAYARASVEVLKGVSMAEIAQGKVIYAQLSAYTGEES